MNFTASNNPVPFFQRLLQSASPEELKQKLSDMAEAMGVDVFRQQAAGEIVRQTQPEQAIPEVYAHYRPLVKDGIRFFLSQISLERLLDVIDHQVGMANESSAEARLFELIKHFSTLHKLGQIIARNKNIDPEVKRWLVLLENGDYGTAPDTLLRHIGQQVGKAAQGAHIDVENTILSEASVAAVFLFQCRDQKINSLQKGVFKVLKPKIEIHLDEELTILKKLATYFEENRSHYQLKDFKFVEVFQDVGDTLEEEINLVSEQIHLTAAARFYKTMDNVLIPRLMPFCTAAMTAMECIEGAKITSKEFTPAQRKEAAGLLFEAVICKPLFSRRETTIFHGDPHAGNLLGVGNGREVGINVALLDWSLAGNLAIAERIEIIQLILGVIKEDTGLITRSILSMVTKTSGSGQWPRARLEEIVGGLIVSEEYAGFTLVKKAFWIVEQLLLHGVVFPPNLLLFRKTIFTLEGVIHDLDPQFDIDAYMINYLAGRVAGEYPQRVGYSFFPLADRSENYSSLLSNQDLQQLLLHMYVEAVRRNTSMLFGLFQNQVQVMGHMFSLPFCFLSSTGRTDR